MSRLAKAAALGVDCRNGRWFMFAELHLPCKGPQHIGCIVIRRDEGPLRNTQDEAIADMLAVHEDLGWDNVHES